MKPAQSSFARRRELSRARSLRQAPGEGHPPVFTLARTVGVSVRRASGAERRAVFYAEVRRGDRHPGDLLPTSAYTVTLADGFEVPVRVFWTVDEARDFARLLDAEIVQQPTPANAPHSPDLHGCEV